MATKTTTAKPAAATKADKNVTKSHKHRLTKWYKADDSKTHFKRRRLIKQRPTKLRRSIKPGSVLILLAGRFRGKRVVFLKQLPSGLLLVTGPHKLNGVPLKRVNQSYVQPTTTKVDIKAVKSDVVTDDYFTRVAKLRSKSEWGFFKTRPESDKQKDAKKDRLKKKKEVQNAIDAGLIATIKKVPFLAKYLSARFTISNNFRPHLARF